MSRRKRKASRVCQSVGASAKRADPSASDDCSAHPGSAVTRVVYSSGAAALCKSLSMILLRNITKDCRALASALLYQAMEDKCFPR